MKRTLAIAMALLLAAGAVRSLAAQDDDGFVVIVHPATTVSTISRAELSKIFLKRLRTWEDGSRAMPVNLPPESPLREAFSRRIHDRSVVNIEVYWKRQIFSGRSVPPPEARDDVAVVAYVRRTPGAVGYVDSRTAIEGVRRLRLTE